MPAPSIARQVTIESSRGPAMVLAALASQAAAWTDGAIASELRAKRVTGLRVRVRRNAFVMELARGRRVLAPLICRGHVLHLGAGSRIEATIRPSRAWMALPTTGSILLAVAWYIGGAPPGTTLRYALLLGALWALNIGLATVPVGSDPAAEHAAFVAQLEKAAG
jgi:hypothetical protein